MIAKLPSNSTHFGNMGLIDNVRATLKSTDTEGPFELYVTRTPGYLWALFFKSLHVHPITVTLISIVLGALSGACFYHDTLGWTLLGILLLVWANWYDCADGQLARMTGQRTLIGRILDGFAGDVWFFCIYFFICLRLTPQHIPFTTWQWGAIIWIVCAWAGFRCHGRQCAVSDYYRNIHMWMQLGADRCELDSSADIRARYEALRWKGTADNRSRFLPFLSKDWFEKIYLYFYRSYCEGQEQQTPHFQHFRQALRERWGNYVPERLREEFRSKSLPLMTTSNLLTFDFRCGVLFASLLCGVPWVWPLVELSLMEIWRYRMRCTHEAFCEDFWLRLDEYDEGENK